MSPSRSLTTVTMAASASTGRARSAVSTQCRDSRSANGRAHSGEGTKPGRFQIAPPTRPRQAPLSASTASMTWASRPYAVASLIGPSPRRRVRDGAAPGSPCRALSASPRRAKVKAVLSWIASTCRSDAAAAVCSLQLSIMRAVVTFGLAKKRPACSSPPRSPPSRRRQTDLRSTMRSNSAAPLYRDARRRIARVILAFAANSLLFRPQTSESHRFRVGQIDATQIEVTEVHILVGAVWGDVPLTITTSLIGQTDDCPAPGDLESVSFQSL
jgi:hypothetical protein